MQTYNSEDRPFVIEHHSQDERKMKFRPISRIGITEHARTSGLLRSLSGTQARVLLAVITCTTPNGYIQASARQVALALGVPIPAATLWLHALCWRRFRGHQLLLRIEREEGLTLYTISPMHIRHVTIAAEKGTIHGPSTADRGEVQDHVRKHFAIPVAEAEDHVMRQLGVHPRARTESEEAWVYRHLRDLKFKREDVDALIETFGIDKIRQQVIWLPERPAKNPAKYLVTALLNQYGPPKRLRDVLDIFRANNPSQVTRPTNEQLFSARNTTSESASDEPVGSDTQSPV